MVDINLFQLNTNFLYRYCFLCAWHNTVVLSLQSFLHSSSMLGC